MDSSDIRLTLDEDSDRDEAEASEDDMEDESEEGETSNGMTTRKEGEETGVKEEGEEGGEQQQQVGGSVRQPCILIFDSLAGSSKARTCQTLRSELTSTIYINGDVVFSLSVSTSVPA